MQSTWKRLLKNVQDGISRPLGSREIRKTKVGTVLVNTLYYCLETPFEIKPLETNINHI